MRASSWFFALVIGLLTSVLLPRTAMASAADDVHRLLIAEKFQEAEALAHRTFDSLQGESRLMRVRRLNALYLLIDCAVYQNHLVDPATGALIEQALIAADELYGQGSRQLALPVALSAGRELTLAHDQKDHAEALARLQHAVDLVEHGRGSVAAGDAAQVYLTAAAQTLISKKYVDGVHLAERAVHALRAARRPWEQRRRASALGMLGLLHSIIGDSAESLRDASAGVRLAQKVSGSDSVHYADALAYLGQAQMDVGDNPGMQESFEQAVAIYRRHEWVGAQRTYRAVQSLAFAYRQLGDFERARPLLEEVVAHNEVDAQGHIEWVLPRALSTLAGVEFDSGNVARARQLYERALNLFTTLYGQSNPLYLEEPLIHLGKVAIRQGDLAAAQDFVQRAAAIDATDSSGSRTNEVAELQAHLALARGDPAAAEERFAQSAENLLHRYGDLHQSLVEMLCGKAVAEARLGKQAEAFESAERAEQKRISLLRGVIPALSGSQALAFKKALPTCAGVLLELAERSKEPARVRRAWQLVADSRGLATRLLTDRIAAARRVASAAVEQRWSRWQEAARAYAHALLANASREELRTARDALDAAEARLGAATLAAVGLQPTDSLDALLARAASEDHVVAYAVLPRYDLRPDAREALFAMAGNPANELYAMVDTHGVSRVSMLGNSDAISAKILQWIELLRDPSSDLRRLAETGRAVRAAIWDPLVFGTQPARVFVVPDGGVFRVNLAALPEGDDFLLERGWRFHVLESEHDLAMTAASYDSPRLLLVGAPDFGPTPGRDAQAGICANGFGPLAGSEAEVYGVAHLWRDVFRSPPTLLVGSAATKRSIIRASGHSSVIHIATHAFDATASQRRCAPAYASRGVGLSPSRRAFDTAPPAAALALAQANTFFSSGTPEGILTDTEVMTLPLGGAQWVVLAACDTGLGEVVADEGVFGLRRSFRLAGARTVVMSLWQIDDVATTELMQHLYAARWARHSDTITALADAELTTLAARRRRGESAHPYYWAGFVASGAWQ